MGHRPRLGCYRFDAAIVGVIPRVLMATERVINHHHDRFADGTTRDPQRRTAEKTRDTQRRTIETTRDTHRLTVNRRPRPRRYRPPQQHRQHDPPSAAPCQHPAAKKSAGSFARIQVHHLSGQCFHAARSLFFEICNQWSSFETSFCFSDINFNAISQPSWAIRVLT